VNAFLRVQARAFNAKDVGTLVGHATAAARCIRDGEWLGEGPDAIRDGLEAEWRRGCVGRLLDVDGEPVLVEYDGEGAGPAQGTIRFRFDGDRITECRIDHEPGLAGRVG